MSHSPAKLSRRRATGALLSVALGAAPMFAKADEGQPIRLLVGFASGGMTDLVARALAEGLQSELGRQVIVDNRAGAGGQIAAQVLKSSRPDGTTLFLTNSHTTAMIPLTVLNPGFDTAKDFAAVGLVATSPNFFIVNPALVGNDVNTVKDFVQWAKSHPGGGNVGVPAPGSSPEFSISVLAQTYGVDLTPVPYRGDAPLVQDMVAGQLAAGIAGIAVANQYVKLGKLKLLAVDGPSRLEAFPQVPTYKELGVKGLDDVIFIGVLAPAGVPPALVAQYNAAINKVVASRSFLARVSDAGIVPRSGTPEDMARLTEESRQSNIPLVKAAGYVAK